MKFVILIGPQAVGKMTIGQELEQISGLKLFHNHMTIEFVSRFFNYGTAQGRKLVNNIRAEFFHAFAESNEPGFIFTFVWAFGQPGEREYVESISKIFEDKGVEVFWVELEAQFEERLRRNKTDNRLDHKPSKRDLEFSEKMLINSQKEYRLNSLEGEISRLNYLKIDNTNLPANIVAKQIYSFLS